MPAPKMVLNSVPINQVDFGYTSEIHTGIKWDFVGDNYQGYKNGAYFTMCNFPEIFLDEEMSEGLSLPVDRNVYLNLDANSGLYPFTPLHNNTEYSVRISDYGYGGLLKSPWKHTSLKLTLHCNPTKPEGVIDYSNGSEGSLFMWNGIVEVEPAPSYAYRYPMLLNGIRDLENVPDINLQQNYVFTTSEIGLPYTILTKHNPEFTGITTTVEFTGNTLKTHQILRFLLEIKESPFYVGDNLEFLFSTPSEQIKDPDYWIFGRRIPMSLFHSLNHYWYAYHVKCISNPIIVTHNHPDSFTITVKLALIV